MGQFLNQPDFATQVETISAFPATPELPSAIYIGTAEDPASVTVVTIGGQTVTFTGIASGSFLPVVCTEITSSLHFFRKIFLYIS